MSKSKPSKEPSLILALFLLVLLVDAKDGGDTFLQNVVDFHPMIVLFTVAYLNDGVKFIK
jgi:hypothetical protein